MEDVVTTKETIEPIDKTEKPEPTTIRLFGTAGESFVDGPGVRMAIFVQGCPHHCPGCHNPESQLFGDEYGEVRDIDELASYALSNPLLSGITLSGGEPFSQAAECAALARKVKELRPEFTVWTYTGHLCEKLMKEAEEDVGIASLLEVTDVLVDGPFIMDKKTFSTLFRGSSNQRLIDMPATLEKQEIIEISEEEFL